MKMKTKMRVALALIVAAFYTLEVVLTLIQQGLSVPVFVKAGIVVAAVYYAVTAIRKSKLKNTQSSE